MEIQEMTQGATAVLMVRGQMVNGFDVAPLKARIKEVLHQGALEVVIDLSDVSLFGAAMVGALVGGLMMVRAHGGRLRLVGANKRIVQVLVATRLSDAFEIEETENHVSTRLQLVG